MSELVEPVDPEADALKRTQLCAQGALLRIDDMDMARAFVAEMGEHSVERLAQACLERGRVPSLVARIARALENRPELMRALVQASSDD